MDQTTTTPENSPRLPRRKYLLKFSVLDEQNKETEIIDWMTFPCGLSHPIRGYIFEGAEERIKKVLKAEFNCGK